MTDKIAQGWFVLSTVVIAVLAYMFHRRGRKLSRLAYEVQRERLSAKLSTARKKAEESEVGREKARAKYDALLGRYSTLAKNLGIEPRSPASPADQS